MAETLITGGKIEKATHNNFRGKVETRTAAGNLTLTVDSPMIQFIDPGGAGRNVVLPAEADSDGLMFIIINTADAAEILTVQDDTPATVVTPTQAETAWVFCNGTTWEGMVGANS